MEPQSEGRRRPPTDRIRTALGLADGNERRVAIHLQDEGEEHVVAELFQTHGWQVLLCGDDIILMALEENPILCITDSGDAIALLSVLGGTMAVVAVTSGSDADEVAAYIDGADWVEPRPLDMRRAQGLRALAAVD